MSTPEMTALVTGAASGIGAATATLLAAGDVRVFAVDRDAAKLKDVVSAIRSAGGSADAIVADLTNDGGVTAVLESTPERLDSVALCAGIYRPTVLDPLPTEAYREVMDVDVNTPVRLGAALIPRLRAASSGRLVFVSSIHATHAEKGSLAYGIAKAGLEAAVRAFAVELASSGILVNAVAPGFVMTQMSLLPDGTPEHESDHFRSLYIEGGRLPLRRSARPEEIASAIVFLLGPSNTYITGHALVVDGGLTATF